MGFFSGILGKVAPIVGGIAGSIIPGVGTALGAGLGAAAGKIFGGNQDEGPQQYSAGTPYDWQQFGSSMGNTLGGMAGPAFSAASAQAGIEQQNQWNAEQYQKQMDFNAAEAEKNRGFQANQTALSATWNFNEAQRNRDFQERMSNTQYQRAVGDMEAAGLNPMLAYSQGGAGGASGSTGSAGAPGGSAASVGSAPRMENAAGPGIATAIETARLMSTLRNQDAQTELMRAQTTKTGADTEVSVANVDNIRQMTENLVAQWENISKDTQVKAQQAITEVDKQRLLMKQRELMEVQRQYYNGQITYTDALRKTTILRQSRESAYSSYYDSPVGKLEPYSDQILNSAGKVKDIATPWKMSPPVRKGESGSSTHYDAEGNVTGGSSYNRHYEME